MKLQSFPKHSGLELRNIQEKSQLGTGTPDEFPRFPEISRLRQGNILEKSGKGTSN